MQGKLTFTVSLCLATLAVAGCINFDAFVNNTKEIEGQVGVVFTNSTIYNISFTWGTWNDLDRQTPRLVDIDQVRLSGLTSTDIRLLPCARNMAIGTDKFVDWVMLSSEIDELAFEIELLNPVVHFSDAATDTDASTSPTVGTAEGVELLLGLDYSCDDQIMITFVEDPDATGGFRLEWAVIKDQNRDE